MSKTCPRCKTPIHPGNKYFRNGCLKCDDLYNEQKEDEYWEARNEQEDCTDQEV